MFHVEHKGYARMSKAKNLIDIAEAALRTILTPLAIEARKHDSFEDFEKYFIRDIHHGLYWHVTSDPEFRIDMEKGPRDMSSMGSGRPSAGALMVTSHLSHWASAYGATRKYAALIDLSALAPNEYRQVSRGFGNEFFLASDSARKAKVVRVMKVGSARAMDNRYHRALPGSSDQLEEFWTLAREGREAEFVKPGVES